jgi:hypothetical protein
MPLPRKTMKQTFEGKKKEQNLKPKRLHNLPTSQVCYSFWSSSSF